MFIHRTMTRLHLFMTGVPLLLSARGGGLADPSDLVQRPAHACCRMHQRPATLRRHDQRLDGRLPFRALVFDLRQPGDVIGGILERDATARPDVFHGTKLGRLPNKQEGRNQPILSLGGPSPLGRQVCGTDF
jgi:hypothetical protein